MKATILNTQNMLCRYCIMPLYLIKCKVRPKKKVPKVNPFNPNANFLDFFIETIGKEVDDATDMTCNRIRNILIEFYKQKRKLKYSYIGKIKKEYLPFHAITSRNLKKFEKWMEEQEYKKNSVITYLKYIKSSFEKAHKKGIINEDYNPFSNGKYVLPAPSIINRNLELKTLTKLYKYTPNKKVAHRLWSEELAFDFWTMGLISGGTSTARLLKLEKEQLKRTYLDFSSSKIQEEEQWKGKDKVIITPAFKILLKKWGNKSETSKYVFPFLELKIKDTRKLEAATSGISDKKTRDKIYEKTLQKINQRKISSFIIQMNRYMNKIAENLNLNRRITSYVAVQTFRKSPNSTMSKLIDPLKVDLIKNIEKRWLQKNANCK